MTEQNTAINKESKRFLWSHHHPLHRFLVKVFNRMMKRVPFNWKYRLGKSRRKNRYPYSLIKTGDVVVQIGAPIDTLGSGRSRGMYFALFVGESGKAIIVEPDDASREYFNRYSEKYDIPQIEFVHSGAWSEKKRLKFYIDPKHPATNFTEGVREYSEREMSAYEKIELDADTIDNLLESRSINEVFMISITTNGAEPDILKGMKNIMNNGLEYICLARTGEKYMDLMSSYGYRLFAHDDRGYTFKII